MWGDKVLKTFIAEYITPFSVEEKQIVGMYGQFFSLLFTECIDRLVLNLSGLLATKFFKDNTHTHTHTSNW